MASCFPTPASQTGSDPARALPARLSPCHGQPSVLSVALGYGSVARICLSCLAMDPETEQGLQNNNCQSPNGSCWFLQRRMGSRGVGNCWKVPAHPVRQPCMWLISANFCSHNVERLGGFVSLFQAFLDENFLEPLLWNLQPWLYF